MEKIFVDTSALYALVSAKDQDAQAAVSTWKALLQGKMDLVTNNYVLVESFALIQNRLGLDGIRQLELDVAPFLLVDWIGKEQHHAALNYLFAINRRSLSLIDCSSFESMKRLGIRQVFSFDKHFREQGFEVIP